MFLAPSKKTNWFQIIVLVAMTTAGVFAIRQAFEKPFVTWQTYNEVRAAEIRAVSD